MNTSSTYCHWGQASWQQDFDQGLMARATQQVDQVYMCLRDHWTVETRSNSCRFCMCKQSESGKSQKCQSSISAVRGKIAGWGILAQNTKWPRAQENLVLTEGERVSFSFPHFPHGNLCSHHQKAVFSWQWSIWKQSRCLFRSNAETRPHSHPDAAGKRKTLVKMAACTPT